MFGQYVADQVAAVIQEHGETMVLKRAGHTDISLKGKRLPGVLEEVGGNGAVQQEFNVKISVVELAASAWAVKKPVRGDRIAIGGRDRMVLDATPLSDGGVVALYELQVSG
jgi:hypothetical protein